MKGNELPIYHALEIKARLLFIFDEIDDEQLGESFACV